MLAVYTMLVVVGYAVGRLHTDALYWARAREPRPLPAATARAIERTARRNRADLRLVMRPIRGLDVRDVEPQRRRLGEPPTFLSEEHTR